MLMRIARNSPEKLLPIDTEQRSDNHIMLNSLNEQCKFQNLENEFRSCQ
jgi:hypothetical protein